MERLGAAVTLLVGGRERIVHVSQQIGEAIRRGARGSQQRGAERIVVAVSGRESTAGRTEDLLQRTRSARAHAIRRQRARLELAEHGRGAAPVVGAQREALEKAAESCVSERPAAARSPASRAPRWPPRPTARAR